MSQISVSSATAISSVREDMDVEVDSSPQPLDHLDHPYSAPQQVVEVVTVRDSVQETAAVHEDVKPKLDELQPVKLEPNAVNLSPRAYHQLLQQQQQQQCKYEEKLELNEAGGSSYILPLDNKLIMGLILQIPINDVPYSVTHDDLIKALSVSDDKIAVRTMRKVIPCLRITTYSAEADFIGKKKIKGLWTTKPNDWPTGAPYKDPNNGEKVDGRVVPKANSEELKMMFSFLKKKFLMNIQDRVQQLTKEELETIKSAASQQTQQYDFTQQPSTPKSSSPTYSQPQHGSRSSQVKEPVLVKHELGQFFSGPPVTEDTVIPTLVNDFCNSSPETTSDNPEQLQVSTNDQPQQIYCVPASVDGQQDLAPGEYVQYEQGGITYIVQLNGSPSSSSNSEASPVATEVPETTIDTVPQDVRAHKRPAPEESDREGTSPVVVSGKRVCEEEEIVAANSPSSRGPIQQVSSPTGEVSAVQGGQQMPHQQVPTKATIEVAPQLRPATQQTPAPPPTTPLSQQPPPRPPSMQMPPAMQMAPSPFASSPLPPAGTGGGMMYSPVSPMPPNQYRTDIRGSLIHDLHTRIREKVNYVQNMTLGDVELCVKLNTMYQSVLWNHYQKARLNEPNNFINAVHACEALVERAIVDGSNFSRDNFKEECDAVIDKYSGEADLSQKLVLNVAEPEHPPIQSEEYARLQSGGATDESSLPSPAFPKSPGTFLTKKMDELGLDKSSTTTQPLDIDVSQLGIRTKLEPLNGQPLFEQLQNLVQKRVPAPVEASENVLPLPEKLAAMGWSVDTQEISPEAMFDMEAQLDELRKLIEGSTEEKALQFAAPDTTSKTEEITVDESTEVITIDDDDDDETYIINLQHTETTPAPTVINNAPQGMEAVTTPHHPTTPAFGAPTFNNQPAVAGPSGCWPQAQREMNQAMGAQNQPSGLLSSINEDEDIMNTDDMLDNILGLELDYDHFNVDWSGPKQPDKQQESSRFFQPSTSDTGQFHMETTQIRNHPPPPYPFNDGRDGIGTSADQGQQHNQNVSSLMSLLTENARCQNTPSGRPADVINTPALQFAIPEVVENFESMDCTESEPKPGTRGRKKSSKGKARK